jgi:hypothetical protein
MHGVQTKEKPSYRIYIKKVDVLPNLPHVNADTGRNIFQLSSRLTLVDQIIQTCCHHYLQIANTARLMTPLTCPLYVWIIVNLRIYLTARVNSSLRPGSKILTLPLHTASQNQLQNRTLAA